MNILFCTDGTDYTHKTFLNIFPVLKKDSNIDILNVVDDKNSKVKSYLSFGNFSVHEYSENILNKTKEFFENNDLKINKTIFLKGKPSEVILNYLKETQYDLIVVGSHSKKGLKKWLGSVSRQVVNRAKIPVLIAKNSKDINTKNNILLATDGSKNSLNAIKKSMQIINFEFSSFDIITIYPGAESLPIEISMDNQWLENCMEKQKKLSEEILLTTSNCLKEKYNLKINNLISKEGDSAEEILNYISLTENNLIIVGSHGKTGLAELLLGSVSKRVLDNSMVSVLVIPTIDK